MLDGHPAPEATTPVAPHVPVVSMHELLGAIGTVVQAEVASVTGRIDVQCPPPPYIPEAPVTSAGTCKGISVGARCFLREGLCNQPARPPPQQSEVSHDVQAGYHCSGSSPLGPLPHTDAGLPLAGHTQKPASHFCPFRPSGPSVL